MCNQTVSLVAAELERQGIATVAVQLLRLAAERVGPPRALLVPFDHGYPLGAPHDLEGRRRIVRAGLDLIERADGPPPVLVEWTGDAPVDGRIG